jgi:hypothetical protein
MDFRGLGTLINILIVSCVLAVPLALWKLIELVVWVFKHIHIFNHEHT